ncbi:DUF4435 domain-containing protein [Flectobacillus sp.]|uniref:DUF4435 domain-containing protein n=1 Tax=Flectobacillus sp. TaxID=50419 RepID=UPI003BA988A6
MASKKAVKPILVYVESYDDVAFWHTILSRHNSSPYRFEIYPASQDSLSKGKNEALKRSEELLSMSLGNFLIICVDSDYDYILQDHTPQSTKINQSDYILQTYSYAIENLRCFSESLDEVCVRSCNRVNNKLDFSQLLENYSEIIYEAFTWSVCLVKNIPHFNIKPFIQAISFSGQNGIQIDLNNIQSRLVTIEKQVKNLINDWQKEYPDLKEEVIESQATLKELGIEAKNTYLFVRGHTLQDDFLIYFLKSVCNTLKKEEIDRINQIAGKNVGDSIKQYENSTKDVKYVLSLNTSFESCFLYQKIKHDIERLMAKLDR